MPVERDYSRSDFGFGSDSDSDSDCESSERSLATGSLTNSPLCSSLDFTAKFSLTIVYCVLYGKGRGTVHDTASILSILSGLSRRLFASCA